MRFTDRDPMDVPAPPTVEDVSSSFAVPIMSFIPQPSLSDLGIGTAGSSTNGGPMALDSVALSFTVWRNPGDHDDPANLVELTDSQRASLDSPPPKPLPQWMIERRNLMRFPALWEAVMTTRLHEAPRPTPGSTLLRHVNHILSNSFRGERVIGGFPGDLESPVSERHIEHTHIPIDGIEVPGIRIDTDPHVYAVGATLGDRILTAVVARDHLPYVTVAFTTLPGRAAPRN